MNEKLNEVREERTGWRDRRLDKLLEENGFRQPDSFLVTEYNYGKSVAIIEYKKVGNDFSPDERLVKYCDLRKNKEFYFIVLYDYINKESLYAITKFIIYPSNQSAIEKFGAAPIEMSELEYIDFLYKIRGNSSSKYREKAFEEYKEWFPLHVTFDIDKQIISARHRSYAYDVPAADIDCIVCDHTNTPYLFIEYKENNNFGTKKANGHNDFINKNIDFSTLAISEEKMKALNNKAIADLGDGCKIPIPVLAVEYNLENKIFSLYAFNKCASQFVKLGHMYQEEYFKYIKEPSNFLKAEEKKVIERICPRCGNKLELREGKYGKFYGCTGYKSVGCRYTENYKKEIT